MRKAFLVVVVAAVLLSLGWVRASRTARQDCCHPSAAKSAATSAVSMAAFGADDVRNEFHASSQKGRVLALLSPSVHDGRRLLSLQAGLQRARIATTAAHVLDASARGRRSRLVVVCKPNSPQRGSG